MLALKVTMPFGDHVVGETITGKAEMNDVLASNPAFVVRVHLTDDEEAAAKAAAKSETKPNAPRA